MSPTAPDGVLVVIPAYNEARNIRRVAAAVIARGYKVLVIDDGSSDGTAAEAAAGGAEVHSLPGNRGKGAALREGFRLAAARGTAAVVTMDGDGQHDPAEIDALVTALDGGAAGLVVGTRMRDAARIPFVRRWTNRMMSRIVSWLAHTWVSDTQSGFRAIRCDVLRDLELVSARFEIESEMIIRAGRRGHVIREAPISVIYGTGEVSSIRPVRDTLRFICFAWRMLWR